MNALARYSIYGLLIGGAFGLLGITTAALWLSAAPFSTSTLEAVGVTAGFLSGPLCPLIGQCIGAVTGLRKELRTGDGR